MNKFIINLSDTYKQMYTEYCFGDNSLERGSHYSKNMSEMHRNGRTF